MTKWIYMIDYESKIDNKIDQIECENQKDLITQLKLMDKKDIVYNVKKVMRHERETEEYISYSLACKVAKILGYRPVNLGWI